MSTLLDTNLLTRMVKPAQPMHEVALDAVAALRRRNEPMRIVPQNLYEFWVVATRPAAQNGLGLTPSQADAEIARFTSWFTVIPDDPCILPRWRQLVVQQQVIGKNGHDARLIAAMLVHGVDRLLTFNKACAPLGRAPRPPASRHSSASGPIFPSATVPPRSAIQKVQGHHGAARFRLGEEPARGSMVATCKSAQIRKFAGTPSSLSLTPTRRSDCVSIAISGWRTS